MPTKTKTANLDKFGCKAGSQAAAINACVGSHAKKVETIVSQSGLDPDRVKTHLKAMIANGFVEETERGFRQVSQG